MRRNGALVVLLVALIPALIAAGCGGDDDDETTTQAPGEAEAAALYDEIADLPDQGQIERVGAAWAGPFAAGEEEMCQYLHPDLAGCFDHFLDGALTESLVVQRSFAGATVKSVEVKGRTAFAEFSNGERVEFKQDPNDDWTVIDPLAE